MFIRFRVTPKTKIDFLEYRFCVKIPFFLNFFFVFHDAFENYWEIFTFDPPNDLKIFTFDPPVEENPSIFIVLKGDNRYKNKK